uniref:Alternative protein CHST7 n=1 Tax=Homo sapiens TaxID=9606 RepID=L8EA50_HUMAN|nr:alternative protein CHST7 [Homo sapiens]
MPPGAPARPSWANSLTSTRTFSTCMSPCGIYGRRCIRATPRACRARCATCCVRSSAATSPCCGCTRRRGTPLRAPRTRPILPRPPSSAGGLTRSSARRHCVLAHPVPGPRWASSRTPPASAAAHPWRYAPWRPSAESTRWWSSRTCACSIWACWCPCCVIQAST